jgi:hypothetical protein
MATSYRFTENEGVVNIFYIRSPFQCYQHNFYETKIAYILRIFLFYVGATLKGFVRVLHIHGNISRQKANSPWKKTKLCLNYCALLSIFKRGKNWD